MAVTEVKLTVFQRLLEKKLFPDSTWFSRSRNGGNSNADTIEIPQSAGSVRPILGGVNSGYDDVANNLANGTALTPVIRVNNKKSYSNVIIRPPNPFVFETLQEETLTYNKAASIAEEEAENMNAGIADYMATAFAPTLAANILPTTGLNKAGTVTTRSALGTTGAVSGYAGLVKRFAYADYLALQSAIKKQNITGGTWYALITVEMWNDLIQIDQLIDFEKTGNAGMLAKGVIGKLGHIMFLDPRQNDTWNANLLYDVTTPATPLVVAYAGALNANCVSAMLVWNDQKVERNEGGIKFFSRKNDPIYMGDITQWGSRIGGTSRRLDEKGTIAVYETPTT